MAPCSQVRAHPCGRRRGWTGWQRSGRARGSHHPPPRPPPRAGLPCRICGTAVQDTQIAARRLFWCPVCQA
ncbi:zinc finger domain-containing protein [uncultured Nocardioides sp.]|uniref:zinc finger domain-containing protein n=1 Tax=uncultured Nocardioides sp. TaxID=198441 RepID=UPI003452F9C2